MDLLAAWDFTKGSAVSTDGKYALHLRGNTSFRKVGNKTMLQIGMSSKAEGAQFSAVNKELYSAGPFRYEFTLRMWEPDSTRVQLILFDSKYSLYKPGNHTGLALVLNRFQGKVEQYRMTVYAGLASGRSATFSCPAGITLKEDQTYTLAYEYDGKETFSYYLNGKKVGVRTLKGAGPIQAPDKYHGVIGDRYGSSFSHFQGDILSVKIFGIRK